MLISSPGNQSVLKGWFSLLLAAQTLGMCEAIDGGLYVSALYCEIVYGKSSTRLPIEVVTDNQSLCHALASSKYVSDRRLRIDIGSLKELIADKHIEKITWVCAEGQLADSLTKNGASVKKLIDVLSTGHLPDVE